MFRRFKESWQLTKSCWAVLQKDKQLLLFPVLSGILSVLLVTTFVAPGVYMISQNPHVFDKSPVGIVGPLLLFLLYFCLNSVILFCNTAVLICVKQRFEGGSPTLSSGISGACKFLPQILSWAFLGGCLGVILRQLEESFGIFGALLARLLGGAWAVVSFFALPVMIFEGKGPMQALPRSKEIISQTWGQSLGAYLGLNALSSLFGLFAVLAMFSSVGASIVTESAAPLGVTIVVLMLSGLCLAIVSSCLTQIFQAALYVYATTKEVPSCFDSFAMEGAFQERKGRKWILVRR